MSKEPRPRTELSAYARMTIPSAEREANDFYPTPPGAVWPLLRYEEFPVVIPYEFIWDPACGQGNIAEVFKDAGYDVFATDLIDRGYGYSNFDFLNPPDDLPCTPKHIVTNPPFKHAQQFVERGLELVPGKVCILARLQWLESAPRRKLFETGRLARVWVFSNRVPFQRGRLPRKGEGGRMMAYAWFVFDPRHDGPPTLGWLTYEDAGE